MAPKALPPIDLLRQLLRYEPDTGRLIWLPRDESLHSHAKQWNGRMAGKPAMTSPDAAGYLKGCIFNAAYMAHRVAWAIHYGKEPSEEIDHINGNKQDNRILNLRVVGRRDNMKNRLKQKNNQSGVTGVSWSGAADGWVSNIGVRGNQLHIGTYSKFEDAVKARKAAELRLGYHQNHGA